MVFRSGIRVLREMTGRHMEQPVGETAFHEEQRPWPGLVAIGIVSCSGAAVFFVYAMVEQLVLHRPLGDRPMPDAVLAILGPVAIVLAAIGLILVCTSRLVIEVRHDGLYVQYVPIHFRPKRISLDQVASVQSVIYRPILRYGGWGIRWIPKGKAYNARGNRGVRLDYANGRHLLLGSQRPQELAGAIDRLRQRETQGQGQDRKDS